MNFRKYFRVALVAALIGAPAFASANVLTWAGLINVGQTISHPFAVTTAGTFIGSSTCAFCSVTVSIPGEDTATGNLFAIFSEPLAIGSYTLNVRNNGGLDPSGYLAALSSRTGVAVPEPASLLLLGTGLLAAGLIRRRRRAA